LMPAVTAENMKPLGRNIGWLGFAVILAVSPASWLWKDSKPRQLAFYHRDLVTIVIARTDAAVFVDLVRQVFTLRNFESKLGKKLRGPREQADATDLVLVRLRHQGLDEQFSAAALLECPIDGDGANLGEMRTVQVQRATANDVAGLFEDNEITHVLADLGKRTGEERSVGGI
jgi:hypothetical protein